MAIWTYRTLITSGGYESKSARNLYEYMERSGIWLALAGCCVTMFSLIFTAIYFPIGLLFLGIPVFYFIYIFKLRSILFAHICQKIDERYIRKNAPSYSMPSNNLNAVQPDEISPDSRPTLFCNLCGARLIIGSAYCSKCGQKLF